MQTMSDETIALISEPDLYKTNTKRVGCGHVDTEKEIHERYERQHPINQLLDPVEAGDRAALHIHHLTWKRGQVLLRLGVFIVSLHVRQVSRERHRLFCSGVIALLGIIAPLLCDFVTDLQTPSCKTVSG
ncbi:hypothetical protein PAL_GLEAN10015520 [Pteropus alecto]|uniref:Uncharacterized protein n=1 Tax=Pteropus alecto TaxID=9402 RepID=L5KF96_PTEAL|nr:hypothetical protein PAL_GLEAN10015520 [Pteropus alecto]